MNLEMITEGLKQLLQENNYSSATIRFYEGEWNKIQCFLTEEYGNTEYDMERGLKYLEKQYGFITKYNNGTLSQQRVQLLRVVHMLEDYRLHQVLTRRYYASKNPITLNAYYLNLCPAAPTLPPQRNWVCTPSTPWPCRAAARRRQPGR